MSGLPGREWPRSGGLHAVCSQRARTLRRASPPRPPRSRARRAARCIAASAPARSESRGVCRRTPMFRTHVRFPLCQQHRQVPRIVVLRPLVDEPSVDVFEVAQSGMESSADDRLGHVVTAFRHSLGDPCDRILGGRQTQKKQLDPVAPSLPTGNPAGVSQPSSMSSRMRRYLLGAHVPESVSTSTGRPEMQTRSVRKGLSPAAIRSALTKMGQSASFGRNSMANVVLSAPFGPAIMRIRLSAIVPPCGTHWGRSDPLRVRVAVARGKFTEWVAHWNAVRERSRAVLKKPVRQVETSPRTRCRNSFVER